MMKIRSGNQLKAAFKIALNRSRTKKDVATFSANVILGDLDAIMINAWSAMSDMGYSKAQYDKIKKIVKRRFFKYNSRCHTNLISKDIEGAEA